MKSVSVGLFQHKNGVFYTIKRMGGKQHWRSLETTDKIEALKKLVFQFDTTSIPAQPEPQQNFPTFKVMSEQWLKSISHTIKPSTYEWRRYCLLNLNKKFADLTINAIKPEAVETWMHWRLKHASPTTANYELGTLRLVFNYAKGRSWQVDNPVQIKAAKVWGHKQPTISTDDFKKLLSHMDGEAKDFVQFLASSGLRVSEAMSLTLADVNLKERNLNVRTGKTMNARRSLPLNTTLLGVVTKRCDEIKAGKNSQPLWSCNHRSAIRFAAKRAEIRCPGFHVFRRYFASRCAELNVPPKTLASWLGHASPEFSLRVYAKTSAEHGLAIAEKLEFQ